MVSRLADPNIEVYDDDDAGRSRRSQNSEGDVVNALDAEGDGDMGALVNHAQQPLETEAQLENLRLVAIPLPKRSSLPKSCTRPY